MLQKTRQSKLPSLEEKNNHTDAQKGQVKMGSVLQVEIRILGSEMKVIEENVVLRLDAAKHCSKNF